MHFVLMGIALEKAKTSMLVESLRVWSETVRVSEREKRASERLAAAAAAERMLQAAAHCLAISQERPSFTHPTHPLCWARSKTFVSLVFGLGWLGSESSRLRVGLLCWSGSDDSLSLLPVLL